MWPSGLSFPQSRTDTVRADGGHYESPHSRSAPMELEPEEEEEESGEETVEDMYDSWDTSDDSDSANLPWITWFCNLPGNDYLCEVMEEFIEDNFNLTDLSSCVPYYQEALELILDLEPEEYPMEADANAIEDAAATLYSLIHQRFILTQRGLQLMLEKYERVHYGVCPRVCCYNASLLPYGHSTEAHKEKVTLYCPRCRDLYFPNERHKNLDGAYFGPTFPHFFFQVYDDPSLKVHPEPRIYLPRIFGFRINERSLTGSRMLWLRQWHNPADEEVDGRSGDPESNKAKTHV